MSELNIDQVDLKRLNDECDLTEAEVRRAFGERIPEEDEFSKRVADAQTRDELKELLEERVIPPDEELYALYRFLGLSGTPSEVREVFDLRSLELGNEEVAQFVLKAAQKLSSLLGEGTRIAKNADAVYDLLDQTPPGGAIESLVIQKLAGFYRK